MDDAQLNGRLTGIESDVKHGFKGIHSRLDMQNGRIAKAEADQKAFHDWKHAHDERVAREQGRKEGAAWLAGGITGAMAILGGVGARLLIG